MASIALRISAARSAHSSRAATVVSGVRSIHGACAALAARDGGVVELNKVSKTLTASPARTAAQAMLEAAYSNTHAQLKSRNPSAPRPRGDMPHVGIASVWWEGNPCNMHLLDLSARVRDSVCAADCIGLRFNTIGVSDGISMGTRGMAYSLPSRDLIADSVESVLRAQWYDGAVVIPGCDKNMPGVIMGITRVNVPALMVYGGTIAAGCSSAGAKLDIVSAFQSYGELLAGRIDERTRRDIAAHACPGPGACGGMYTANTIAVAIEAMGMTLPHSSSTPAAHAGKGQECDAVGPVMKKLLALDLRPRDILTRDAFHNAIVTVMALGGSTNAVLHLIAMAATAGVPITIDDFQRISDSTPFLANLKPSGEYVMEDMHGIGGTPAVMAYLNAHGLLKPDAMSVTGQRIGDLLKSYPPLKASTAGSGAPSLLDASGRPQSIIRPLGDPLKPSGHISILRGNLSPGGAVAKLTGKEGLIFTGQAAVYECEEDMMAAFRRGELHARLGLPVPAQQHADEVQTGESQAGVAVAVNSSRWRRGDTPADKVVVVIRYEGPVGGPGMPEMLTPTSAIMGAGLSHRVALITDGRFSGGSHGFIVGHITPEAAVGGPVALVQDGDSITIDANARTMDVHVSEADMATRRAEWTPPAPRVTSGVLAKYIRLVASASHGCVTDGAGVPPGAQGAVA